jgi:hypothetical protein
MLWFNFESLMKKPPALFNSRRFTVSFDLFWWFNDLCPIHGARAFVVVARSSTARTRPVN